jgi:hypothetical protein
MKNILGHDNESEIITVIKRLREGKFKVISFSDNEIKFEIILTYRYTVPVPSTTTQKIEFIIKRIPNNVLYDYYFQQLYGIEMRKISLIDGFFIWGLLEESI